MHLQIALPHHLKDCAASLQIAQDSWLLQVWPHCDMPETRYIRNGKKSRLEACFTARKQSIHQFLDRIWSMCCWLAIRFTLVSAHRCSFSGADSSESDLEAFTNPISEGKHNLWSVGRANATLCCANFLSCQLFLFESIYVLIKIKEEVSEMSYLSSILTPCKIKWSSRMLVVFAIAVLFTNNAQLRLIWHSSEKCLGAMNLAVQNLASPPPI